MRLGWLLLTTVLMGWWVAIIRINQINSQAGLYCDEMGQVLFYTTQMRMVSYADLRPVQLQGKFKNKQKL